ncbi:hypothetical protein N0V82_004340, partial [Gnomoniopsis sp. IMI 355080]
MLMKSWPISSKPSSSLQSGRQRGTLEDSHLVPSNGKNVKVETKRKRKLWAVEAKIAGERQKLLRQCSKIIRTVSEMSPAESQSQLGVLKDLLLSAVDNPKEKTVGETTTANTEGLLPGTSQLVVALAAKETL